MWLRAERDLASTLAMVEGGGEEGRGDGKGGHAWNEDAK